jgi:hypothetical protein
LSIAWLLAICQLFKGATFDWPNTKKFFLQHQGHSPIGASLWTLSDKIETKMCSCMSLLFSLCTRESNLGASKPKRDRTEMLLGTCWGNNLKTRGTQWEHTESNEKKKTKKISLMRKAGPLMRACWAFSLAAWDFYSTTGIESRSKRWAHSILRDLFYLVRGVAQVQLIYLLLFCNEPIWLARHQKKKWNYGGSPK